MNTLSSLIMKIFPIAVLFILVSCRKNVREYTTDFQDQYTTNIRVLYDASMNTTVVSVSFLDPIYFYVPAYVNTLKLPSNCELTVNGYDLIWNTRYYEYTFQGKQDCLIEFTDADGSIYTNTVLAVDTLYFIDLPDSVPSNSDFQLQVNGPLLDSNENTVICLDGHGEDYGCYYTGTDSSITLEHTFLEDSTTHTLFAYRKKSVQNSQLPLGGGWITFSYVIKETFFSE